MVGVLPGAAQEQDGGLEDRQKDQEGHGRDSEENPRHADVGDEYEQRAQEEGQRRGLRHFEFFQRMRFREIFYEDGKTCESTKTRTGRQVQTTKITNVGRIASRDEQISFTYRILPTL